MSKNNKIILNKDKIEKHYFYRFTKRLFDILASLIGLVILSPVFLIVAIAIKIDDGGPIFYNQERIGKNGKEFKMYKFRSMAGSNMSLGVNWFHNLSKSCNTEVSTQS